MCKLQNFAGEQRRKRITSPAEIYQILSALSVKLLVIIVSLSRA